MEVVTRASLICPECGAVREVDMPADACQFFNQCAGCDVVLRPRKGDCCVFCSYADTPCPMKQAEKGH